MNRPATRSPRPVFIFDGACGFCTTSAGVLRRYLDPHVGYAIAPYQRLDLAGYGLTDADCHAAAQFVTASGAVFSGHRAIGQALLHSLPPWRPVGRLLLSPHLDAVVGAAYAWVADHRGLLPSGPPACPHPDR